MFLIDTLHTMFPMNSNNGQVWIECTVWYFGDEDGNLHKIFTDATGSCVRMNAHPPTVYPPEFDDIPF